jgi:hypothetical protein
MKTGKLESPVSITPSMNRNIIINGGMDIWQRGTTSLVNPGNGTYFPDRFSVVHSLGEGAMKANGI